GLGRGNGDPQHDPRLIPSRMELQHLAEVSRNEAIVFGHRLTLFPDWQAPPAPSPAPQRSPRSFHWTAAWVPSPLARRSKLTAPDFDRLARTPWPDGFLCVLRHQGFELGLRPLVIEKGGARGAEETGEFRP